MLITIAIPTYNNLGTISNAIRSCVDQSDLSDCEILVVDNASTDGTEELLGTYSDTSTVRVVRNENTVTMYENHNICLAKARGDYVLFCHSDDRLDVDGVKNLKRHLQQRGFPKRYVCWGHSLFRDYAPHLARYGFRPGEVFAGEFACAVFVSSGVTPSGTCYTRDVISHGGFVESSHHLAPADSSTLVKLAFRGFRFEMMQDLLFFRTTASTATGDTKLQDRLDAYCDTYENLRKEIGDAQLVSLLNLAAARIVYRSAFLYFMAPRHGLVVQKKLVRMAAESPLIVRHQIFWKILIRTLSRSLSGRG